MSFLVTLLVVAAFAVPKQTVCVGSVKQCREQQSQLCRQERTASNLRKHGATRIRGELRDTSGATFSSDYLIQLRDTRTGIVVASEQLHEHGEFTFESVPSRADRLVIYIKDSSGLHRTGFAQPSMLECASASDCQLDIVLQPKATDNPVDQCPPQ